MMGLEIRRESQPGGALETIGLWIVTEATEAEEMALDGWREGRKDGEVAGGRRNQGCAGRQEPQGAHSNITGPGSPGQHWGNMDTQGGLWGGWALWLRRLWAGAAPPLDRRKGGFRVWVQEAKGFLKC